MEKKMRFLIVLLMIVCLGTSVAAISSPTISADESKVLKFSIDTGNADFSSDTFNQLNDETYLAIMTTPFPVTSSGVDVAFKEGTNFFQNWWEGIGSSFTVEYEYAVSHPLQSVGSPAISVDRAPWIYGHGPVDQDGLDAIDPFEDKELISNGWRKRTISYDGAINDPAAVLNDMWFILGIKKGDLPESGSIDLLVKNIYFTYKGVRYAIYDSGAANSFWAKVAKSSFTSEYTTATRFSPGASTYLANGAGLQLSEMAVNDALHYGGTWSEVSMPSIETITLSDSKPLYFVDGNTYDLTSFVQPIAGKDISVKVKLNGQPVEVADVTNFQAQIGDYDIVYEVVSDYTSTRTVSFECKVVTNPVFDDQIVTNAVPKAGNAHENVELAKIKAFAGNKELDTTVEVRKNGESGEEVAVEDNGQTWRFAPTKKSDGVYYVRYKAVNVVDDTEYTAYSNWKQVTVTDVDKPVIDFDTMFDNANVGVHYSEAQITDGLVITDISDGSLVPDSVTIIDSTGKKLTKTEKGYFITNSGVYDVIVRVTDSDNNTVEATGHFEATPSDGCVIQATFNIAAENRAEGIRKYGLIQAFNLSPKAIMLVSGAKIRYEVMAYTVIDGQVSFISGVGALSGQLSPSWQFVHDAFSESAVDGNGKGMKATADLSDVLQKDGKAVWYQREYTVAKDDGIAGTQYYHLAFAMDTTAAVGEQVFVFYRNMELVKPDGETVVSLGKATEYLEDAWKDMDVNVEKHSVTATIDRYPVFIEGEIPTSVDMGNTVILPKYVMKDMYYDEFIDDITYTVLDPTGAVVELTEGLDDFRFVASLRGQYKITVVGANEIGSSTVEVTLKSDDTMAPVVEKESYGEIKLGEDFSATFAISDNCTAFEDLEIEISVFQGSTVVDKDVDLNGGKATVSFNLASEGTYRIIISATDAAGREQVKEFSVEVNKAEEETPAKGCGGAASISGLLGLILLLGASVVGRK